MHDEGFLILLQQVEQYLEFRAQVHRWTLQLAMHRWKIDCNLKSGQPVLEELPMRPPCTKRFDV